MPLQRTRRDAGFAQFLGCAGRRREPFNLVAFALRRLADRRERGRLPGTGHTFQCYDLISAAQNLIDGGALALAQMWRVVLDVPARVVRRRASLESARRPCIFGSSES